MKVLVASGVDLIAKEAQYHKSCRREFFKEVGSVSKTESLSSRRLHTIVFRTIADLIESKVIINGKAMFSTSIFEFYNAEFLSAGGAFENIEELYGTIMDEENQGKI